MKAEIKEYIIREARPFYRFDDLVEVVDLFSEVLDSETVVELSGVGIRINTALEGIVRCDRKHDNMIVLLPSIVKAEAYSRKVLRMIDADLYDEVNSNAANGFSAVLKALKINRHIPNNMVKPPLDIEILSTVYELRNLESHDCKEWTERQCMDIIVDSIVAYLLITKKKKAQIQMALSAGMVGTIKNESILLYANRMIRNFEEKAKRIIQLDSEENLKQLDLYAEEKKEDGDARKGTVCNLMKQVSEKRMILWGDAGTGKTTTLEFLAYQDAKEVAEGKGKIPVIIYLGSATNEHSSLIDYITKNLNIDEFEVREFLRKGLINLYIDGFNEIPLTEMNMLKSKRRREISEILREYPDSFIIITNRPQEGKEFSGIPVFNLLKMNDKQIQEFINKNVIDENVSRIVNQALDQDENLRKMVSIPLILKSLIVIVKTFGEVPRREGQIIGKFLEALFKREIQEKYDEYLDEKKMNLLLRRIGYETLENNHANSGVDEEQLLDIMNACQRDYNFKYDNLYALRLVVNLGILEKRDGLYVFAHQSYQDFYHSQEMLAVLGI